MPDTQQSRRTPIRSTEKRLVDIVELEGMIADGASPSKAVAQYAVKTGLCERQAWRDYRLLTKRHAAEAQRLAREPFKGLGRAILYRERLLALAIANNNHPLALKIVQDHSRLLDLYERDKADREAAVRAKQAEQPLAKATDLSKYRDDPVGYAREVLGSTPTPHQEAIARAVAAGAKPVGVESGHSVGKSWLAAWLINWWYDTRNPSWTISTAPNQRSVRDILWTEVRLQRQRAGLDCSALAPADSFMGDGPEHQAKGYTAAKGEGFQGRHRDNMLFVFDEAEGVPAVYWDAVNTMYRPGSGDGWLVIMNPTTTTSRAAQELRQTRADGSPKWERFTLSAIDHPNIAVGLENRDRRERGESELPLPVPSAVTLEQLEGWLADWFEEVPPGDHDPATDVEFPPGSGKWLRPDGEGEARVLGRRPTAGAYGVWSERVFDLAARPPEQALAWDALADLPEIGCDVARFGTDRTEIHVRIGPCSLAHEDHSGWDTTRTADRLKELAGELAKWVTARRPHGYAPVTPDQVLIKVDDTGVGGGVTDLLRAWELSVLAVNAGESSYLPDKYPRIRDELWFSVRDRAKAGQLDLSRLPRKRVEQLRTQALAPVWTPTPDGRRQVEPKEKTRERTGQKSPDSMDAMNLAYHEPPGGSLPTAVTPQGER